MSAVGLDRRFANFRQGLVARPAVDAGERIRRSSAAAERLASELDGELIRTRRGCFVRVEAPSTLLPLDRERLARLPGQPPPGAPLLCLDTETTGLATAAGTLAFLVGLGWWEGSRFRQVQLLLPDHSDEPALLAELSSHISPSTWLVTYNGRGFDWPLLVARYRLARESPPVHAGHLDLLPLVRRVFRHRMPDARLGTVESVLLGLRRHADVGGWEIPARYLEFLRFGEPTALLEVARHNDEDVRSLARLLVHVDRGYADGDRWAEAPAGDLAGLARAYAGAGRHEEALACVESAIAGSRSQRLAEPRLADPRPGAGQGGQGGQGGARAVRDVGPAVPYRSDPDDDGPWWSPRRRADFGGHP
ncbi:MAG TPA: ribonuclease H-like domain-containing protein, partial [Candidatus Limnocylindrales bacterium]|nr:ribonuclease H-like domain-containing protein [Candidatus Limnocylindrales bacterium]